MKQAAATTTTNTSGGKAQFTAGIIGLTFLDTTWRIVTPVILFTVLGIVADRSLGTKPWLTILVAVPIGFVFAVLLVKRQLEAVEAADKKNDAMKDKKK
jgi:F0F1-type ATP synthase assembly protein I